MKLDRAVGEDEKRPAEMHAPKVVHARAAVGSTSALFRWACATAIVLGRIPGAGDIGLARVELAAHDYAPGDGAGPGAAGLCPGALSGQDGAAGPVRDVGDACAAVAVDNAVARGSAVSDASLPQHAA